MTTGSIQILPVRGLPEIEEGMPLGSLLIEALRQEQLAPANGDILVVTHKIVAKAEGAVVDLRTVEPSALAVQFAQRWQKDPRQVEVVLRQSVRIVRMDRGVLIAETAQGLICANAGVDQSNMRREEIVCILPRDPDASAARIRAEVQSAAGVDVGVVVSDTFGRPWREGLTNIAIGVAGLSPLRDYVGMPDPNGRVLRVTRLAVADELAGAAELVMGKLDRVPAALIRGYPFDPAPGSAQALVRRPELDMFRY
jgi:coenzyme F420-0:L-glutamate ligase/coenzyme F420-1:gamma-L-glutamate ligase